MFKTTAILTAAAIALGSAASANSQLADSLGVEPGVYSTVELVRLKNAIEDNNASEVAFILQRSAEATRAANFADSGSDVSALRLRRAMEDNNTAEVNFILDGGSAGSFSKSTHLASSVGVDAQAFTVSDVIRLKRAKEDNNIAEVNHILAN
ncbi:MAG: hypothetical protein AAGF71_13345 [Pseudomonadota bacterium]